MAGDEAPQITYLYRLFSESDELLYVGIAKNVETRFAQHAKDKDWWEEVAASRVEQFRTRALALAAESTAILWEKPIKNLAIPSVARHDKLQERASLDPFASLDVAQRLSMIDKLTDQVARSNEFRQRLEARRDELTNDLEFERRAGSLARSDADKLAVATRQQQRDIASLEQKLRNALVENQNRAAETTYLRSELDQAKAAIAEMNDRAWFPTFGRRKASLSAVSN